MPIFLQHAEDQDDEHRQDDEKAGDVNEREPPVTGRYVRDGGGERQGPQERDDEDDEHHSYVEEHADERRLQADLRSRSLDRERGERGRERASSLAALTPKIAVATWSS